MFSLLRKYLLPYRKLLLAILVFQAVQTSFQLILPSLNADLINNGIAKGDTQYIWHTGAVML
ncbi:MAG: ABC transporter ATP-binding protein, partial [Acidimicrobiia bacterium]